MTTKKPTQKAKKITQKAIQVAEKFMHIEASSGIVLLFASAVALFLANSNFHDFYENLWHTKAGIQFGDLNFSWDLHFWVNDVLMTFFFLTVGMEIKQEIVFGQLANIRAALLPIIAAIGGVILPAIIFVLFNVNFETIQGWAIPTATDIAFAVGLLALLGKSIPRNVRILLLSLAIIDDIIAILIITFVYSQSIDFSGLYFVVSAFVFLFLFQKMGIDFAPLYVLPGALLWFGLYKMGIHPSITGVILGLLTPTVSSLAKHKALEIFENFSQNLTNLFKQQENNHQRHDALKNVQKTTRHVIAPSERIQIKLHPWVAFFIMPLFAFANAGVYFSGINFQQKELSFVFIGIFLGLVVGKPLGIFLCSFLAVKCKICSLPENVSWPYIILVGMLAGIGFTMAIFVTLLAFNNADFVNIAKIAVLIASATSALLGLLYGVYLKKS